MWVRIPPGTLIVICKGMKVRTVVLWNADISTNIRSILYFVAFNAEPDDDLLKILADNFTEIEKHDFKVDKASVIKQKTGVEIIVINSENLGYRTITPFIVCKKCGRNSLPGSKSNNVHTLNCPYQIVFEIMES